MVVTLIALKAHSYGGKFRKVGDVYSAPRSDARVLKALRKAADAPQTYRTAALAPEPATGGNRASYSSVTLDYTRATSPPVVETAPVEPPLAVVEPAVEAEAAPTTEEPAPEEPAQPEPARPRRRYRRRDLTAESDDSE